MNKTKTISLLKKLSEGFGPSGSEEEIVAILKEELHKEGWRTSTDSIKNLYTTLEKGKDLHIQLDAHTDEVGFIIQSILPNGTMTFLPLGTWNVGTLPSQKVIVRNRNMEDVKGVISSIPPHYMPGEKSKEPLMEDLFIDVGSSSREETMKKFNIEVGDRVVPQVTFSYDKDHDLLFGKAFDCRIGCSAIVETLRNLKSKKLDVSVTGAFSTQEEVGGRGAFISAKKVKPDLCIVFEGTPADDTIPGSAMQTKLGKGPMLRHLDGSMITHPGFQEFAVRTAKKYNIPFQEAVRHGSGTNAGAIHLTNLGVPCIVIGIPVRYIHSPYGFSKYEDLKSSVLLAVAILENMSKEVFLSL